MNDKLLVIRLSAMGDIIFTTPFIRLLKKRTGAQVHFLCKADYAQLLSNNPNIDKLYLFDGDLKKTIKELKSEKYSVVYDLQRNIRSGSIVRNLGIKTFSVSKLALEKWLRINFKIDRLPRKHFADRCIESGGPLNLENDGLGMDFFFPKDFDFTPDNFDLNQDFGVLILGAQHFTKRIPTNKIQEFLERANLPIVLLGGKDVRHLVNELSLENAKSKVIDLSGKTDILESAYIIKKSKLVIGPDTGMLHLAVALKQPTISVWGSTIPEFGVFPYYGGDEVKHYLIEPEQLNCRPCSKHGGDHCPKKHFKCMKNLDVDLLVEKFGRLIE